MKNYKLMLLSTVCAVAIPVFAQAEVSPFQEEWYVGLAAGTSKLDDTTLRITGSRSSLDANWGWAGVGSVGYAYGDGFRTELELGYRTSDNDTVGLSNASGDTTSWSALANVLYDFDVFESGFVPYVGVGAGFAHVSYDVSPTFGSTIDDSDVTPAFQAIIGGSYPINDNWKIFADYRYLTGFTPEFKTATNVEVDSAYDTHNVMLGIRYEFGQPAPAPAPVAEVTPPAPTPPPPPPPPPANPSISRTYIIFFDFDKYNLTEEARAILKDAAADALNGGAVGIEVKAHTDRAGSDKYNQKLSERRGSTVRDELTRLGINSNAITTYAKGESEPLVPTADGVREPQNRRAEIVYIVNQKQ